MNRFIFSIAILLFFFGCSSFSSRNHSPEKTASIYWEIPASFLGTRDRVWITDCNDTKVGARIKRESEGSYKISGMTDGWYRLNVSRGQDTITSFWIALYAGWEAGLVWDPSASSSQDLDTAKNSMHSINPEVLEGFELGRRLTLPQSDDALKAIIPLKIDSRRLVLANNYPNALMGKGGLSSDWDKGAPFYRKTKKSPWVYVLEGDPLGFMEYLLLTKENPFFQDSINPLRKTVDDMGKGNGWLAWPEAPAISQLLPLDADEPAGKLESFTLEGKIPGYSKKIRVYTPPHYSPATTAYKSIYFHDAQMHLQYGITNAFSRWINAGRTPPFIAVFIDNDPEYRRNEFLPKTEVPAGWGQGDSIAARIASGKIPEWYGDLSALYLDLVGTRLVPAIEARYAVSKKPEDRAIHGASNGSIITFVLLNRFPGLFGNAACVSLYSRKADLSRLKENPLRLFFGFGRFEKPVNHSGFMEYQLKASLKDSQKVVLETGAYPGGHDPVSWSADLPRIIDFWWSPF